MNFVLTELRKEHHDAGTVGPCRGCGAMVYWLVSTRNKLTPIDLEPVGMKGNVAIDLDTGTWVHVASRPETPLEQRYVTHFVTCPQAKEFRRG